MIFEILLCFYFDKNHLNSSSPNKGWDNQSSFIEAKFLLIKKLILFTVFLDAKMLLKDILYCCCAAESSVCWFNKVRVRGSFPAPKLLPSPLWSRIRSLAPCFLPPSPYLPAHCSNTQRCALTGLLISWKSAAFLLWCLKRSTFYLFVFWFLMPSSLLPWWHNSRPKGSFHLTAHSSHLLRSTVGADLNKSNTHFSSPFRFVFNVQIGRWWQC